MSFFTEFFTSLESTTDAFKDVFKILRAPEEKETDTDDEDESAFDIGGFKIKIGQTSVKGQQHDSMHTTNAILGNDLFNSARTTTIVDKMIAGEEISALDFLE